MNQLIIELSLSPSYVSNWTILDAIREFLQNAIDAESNVITYDENGTLKISNSGNLSRETILLGSSSKTNDDDKIGQFGEGYKIGLLVLCRNEFKPYINIYSNFRTETWKAFIEHSESFKSEVLKIEITEHPDRAYGVDTVDFIIPNFPKELYEQVVNNTLILKSRYKTVETIKTKFGEILTDKSERGRIYVNGLYVCNGDPKIGYGYNIKPEYLKVDRDRRLIQDFNLFWNTSQMWAFAPKELAVKNVLANIPDVQYLVQSSSSNLELKTIAEMTYTEMKKEYGEDVIVVKDQKEFDTMIKYGNDSKNIKFVEESTYNVITTSSTYRKPEPVYKNKKRNRNPSEVLNDLYEKLDNLGVDQEVLDELDEVINESANWTIQVKEEVKEDLPF